MELLRFENVSMTYHTAAEETEALEDISFSVNKGEFMAVVGPSGCGKTTLLSLAAGLIKPSKGKVTAAECEIGYMLQRDHLFEWRSVYKNITLGLEIKKKTDKESLRHVEELLNKYGLEQFRDYYPRQLSGGMRQRVALIRTLALSPELLLLDEPFSALDFQTRMQVCDDVYYIIRKEKKTALLVTHDIGEAISMAERIVVLSNRPARVKRIHETNLGHIPTPLKRREDKSFTEQFERIWRDINNGRVNNEATIQP